MFDYLDVLAHLHDTKRPRTYLEIGVYKGDSMRLAYEDTVRVGVDPAPAVSPTQLPGCHIETITSDEFFAGSLPRELFGDLPVDLIFIDGMHLFEYSLRDFMGAEALAGPNSLIVVHDCLPRDEVAASRKRPNGDWTGDVWKLVLSLLDRRPDLEISIVDAPPSGLCLAKGLNPRDRILRSGYERIRDEYLPLTFAEWQRRLPEVLTHVVDPVVADESAMRARLIRAEAELDSVYQSTSWRVTAPLRRIGDFMKERRDRRYS